MDKINIAKRLRYVHETGDESHLEGLIARCKKENMDPVVDCEVEGQNKSLLILAVIGCDFQDCFFLLTKGANPLYYIKAASDGEEDGRHAIWHACVEGNLKILKLLLFRIFPTTERSPNGVLTIGGIGLHDFFEDEINITAMDHFEPEKSVNKLLNSFVSDPHKTCQEIEDDLHGIYLKLPKIFREKLSLLKKGKKGFVSKTKKNRGHIKFQQHYNVKDCFLLALTVVGNCVLGYVLLNQSGLNSGDV